MSNRLPKVSKQVERECNIPTKNYSKIGIPAGSFQAHVLRLEQTSSEAPAPCHLFSTLIVVRPPLIEQSRVEKMGHSI
jgi:hypothetical protein